MNEFRAGVTACLRSWSALRTAVEKEWGGNMSIEKAETLREEILTAMFQKKMMDVADLEDALAIYMEEEFSIVLDDNSEKQVAGTIFRMYHDACLNQTTFAMQIVHMAEKVTKEFGHLPLHVQSAEPMDEDDGEDDENDTIPDNSVAMNTEHMIESTNATGPIETLNITNPATYASQPLFGLTREQRRLQIIQKNAKPVRQLGESDPIEQQQQQQQTFVDEDGFVSVTTNHRCKPK
jgi:pre-rRNA-processing protein TSR2